MSERAVIYLLLAYAFVSVVTYGHAWHEIDLVPGASKADAHFIKTTGAFGAGLVWPLYWSVQAFDRDET